MVATSMTEASSEADHVLVEDLIARFLATPEFRRGLVSGRVALPDEKSSEPVDSDPTRVVPHIKKEI